MTVANENNRNDYAGNDSTTVFDVTFRFLEDEDLNVFITEDDGTIVDKVLNTDYTVTGAGEASGGQITMSVAPATGETLTILRDVDQTQEIDYIENDNFPAESHETALDKLTMIDQQQQEEIDRCFKANESYSGEAIILDPEADNFLVWNDTGDSIVNRPFEDITLEFQGDSGGVESVIVDLETFVIAGGDGIDTVSSGLTLTVDVDSTVVRSDGSVPISGVTLNDPKIIDEILTTSGGTAIKMDDGGSVTLYYGNVKALKTLATGIEVYDTSGSNVYIEFKSDADVSLGRIISDGHLYFKPKSGEQGVIVYSDGAVELYNNGALSLKTEATGVSIYDYNADDIFLGFRDNLGAIQGYIEFHNAGSLKIYDSINANNILTYTANSYLMLHHQDNVVLMTRTEGVDVIHSGGTTPTIGLLSSGGVNEGSISATSGDLSILTAAGENGIVVKNNSRIELYFNNIREAETGSGFFQATNSFSIAGTSVIDAILDEDDMISNSASALATQQSIKKYVDDNVGNGGGGGGTLNFSGDAGTGSVDLDTETFAVTGANGISTTAFGTSLGIGLSSTIQVNNIQNTVPEDAIVLNNNSSVVLYHDSVRALSTIVGGINVRSESVAAAAYITFEDSAGTSQGAMSGKGTGSLLLRPASWEPGIEINNNGTVDLYYDGVKAFNTTADGVNIYDTNGSSPILQFLDNTSVSQGDIRTVDGDVQVRTKAGTLSGSFDDGAGVKLYYNGSKTFEATDSGIIVQDSDGSIPIITLNSNLGVASGYILGGAGVQIQTASAEAGITCYDNDRVELNYDGNVAFKTRSDGIEVHDPSGAASGGVYIYFRDSGDTVRGQIYTVGSDMVFRAGPSNNTGLRIYNDGSTRLYYDSSAICETDTAAFIPTTDDAYTLGKDGARWDEVWSANGTIQTSDMALKTELGMAMGLDFITKLRPITYKLKKGLRPHQGLLAQEVKAVIDEMRVDFAGYVDPKATGENGGYKSLRYSEFVAPLIKSVQELKAEVDELRQQIKKLKGD